MMPRLLKSKSKPKFWLPLLLMAVFAATRWPGLMPPNFSAVYGLLFCAGVYFLGGASWWLPLITLAVTDLALAVYYHHFFQIYPQAYVLWNYVPYLILIALGKLCTPRTAWWKITSGGVLGALFFYAFTNTLSWLLNPFGNPDYTRDLAGWLLAMTQGTAGHPPTWEFLRNSLLSGGLFTGLFAAAMKWIDVTETETETETMGVSEESGEDASVSSEHKPEEVRT